MLEKISLRVLPFLVYVILRIIAVTWRITIVNPENSPTPDKNRDQKTIFAFWHNRLVVHTYHYRFCGITAMISKSKDGEYIARLARMLGHTAVRGSTSRDPVNALDDMIAVLNAGKNVTITPDGPQGPKYALKNGVVEMARVTGAAIVPMAYDASRKHIFRSWDGFIFPLLFADIVICFGKAITVPGEMSKEEFEVFRKRIESNLKEITEKAESTFKNQHREFL